MKKGQYYKGRDTGIQVIFSPKTVEEIAEVENGE